MEEECGSQPSYRQIEAQHLLFACRVATKWVYADFAKYKIGRNKISISRNFAKFREMILPKFRVTLVELREILSCH